LATYPGPSSPGDNVYPYGSAENFRNCYDPTWGRYKKRTKPALGNHEYYDENYNMTTNAGPYFDYFGARAGGAARATTPTTAAAGT
jgi:alkaline phosphatase